MTIDQDVVTCPAMQRMIQLMCTVVVDVQELILQNFQVTERDKLNSFFLAGNYKQIY
jgi:hypothetical protein